MRRSEGETAAFLAANAERMRRDPTPAEAKLWELLEPLDFVRQLPIYGRTKNAGEWRYILDFYYSGPEGKFCVEVDGSIHRDRKGRDRRRDSRLKSRGVVTLRFTNKEVLTDHAGVVARIVAAIEREGEGKR